MSKHVLAMALLPMVLGGCVDQLTEEESSEQLSEEEDEEEGSEPMTVGELPELSSLTVDGGKTTDWGNTEPVITDSVGDSTSPATDMVAFYAARSGDRMALLMEVDGNITLPHTPGAEYSHYEVGVDIYTDSACEDELGFVIVNHFTDSGGEVYHGLESYIDNSESLTTVAHGGSYLETSFAIADLPTDTAAVSFNPYIQRSAQPEYIKLDVMDEGVEDICYPLAS